MKDIANRCGVSVATVSKALSGQPDVGAETRNEIKRIADSLGYLPTAAARALKTRRSYNLGILFVDEQSSGLTHAFFSSLLDSFKVGAESGGYDVTFINRNVGLRPTTYLQHCRYRGLDGAVIACVDFTDPQVQELLASDFPVVTIDYAFRGTSVMSDNESGVGQLVRYASSLGHRKIAYIHGEISPVTQARLQSFYQACTELGIESRDGYVRLGEYQNPYKCYEITKQLLALPDRPTCIIFPDDLSYIGGMNAILEAGLSIPGDISVMGYDGIKLTSFISPKLTTWVQDTDTIGAEAARKLIKLVEDPEAPSTVVTVPGKLFRGESVAKIE